MSENKEIGKANKKKSVLPILALILAFVFPLAGFVLAIISLGEKKDKKEISIAALILSIVVSIVSIVLLIIASPFLLGGAFLAFIVGIFASDEKEHEKTDPTKELTNYFYESPIVSARFYTRDRDTNTYIYEDIPEDKIDEFVDALNSLTIKSSSGMHVDYYYGGVSGIECTLEDGTYFNFDGENLIYYDINGERKASRFIYFEEDFWEALEDFNKTKIKNGTTEIEVYGFLDSSDYRDYVYETQDGIYISLNDKLYLYSEDNRELIFECEEKLGPVINITDEYIIFIQRSDKYEKIKKLDLNSGDIKEECYYPIDKYKEAFLDDTNEYLFAYNDEEVLCINISEDEVDYVRNYTVSYDGTIKGAIKDLPEGYYAKSYTYYNINIKENRLLFYKVTEDGEEILKFHDRDCLELINNSYARDEIGSFGDSLYTIDSRENDTLSIVVKGDGENASSVEKSLYEDESNRIIGYNPDNKIVYLYSFENKSVLMKNIEDDSETVIEVLEDADKIEFEWEDSKLYWRYTNDEVETYGGCYYIETQVSR